MKAPFSDSNGSVWTGRQSTRDWAISLSFVRLLSDVVLLISLKPPNIMVFHSFPGCNCSSVGAISNVCNNVTGSCYCQPYVTGRVCDRCEENAFNYTEFGCMPCNCNGDGSNDLQCDAVSYLCAICLSDLTGHIAVVSIWYNAAELK